MKIKMSKSSTKKDLMELVHNKFRICQGEKIILNSGTSEKQNFPLLGIFKEETNNCLFSTAWWKGRV